MTFATPVPGRLPISAADRAAATRAALTRTEPYDLTDAVITHARRWAARSPWRPAVQETGGALGYAALVARADAAASALAARGVRAGQVVAVGGGRGGDVIAAFLALETLGAVYLPIDPAWPAERIGGVLTDSGAVLLVLTGDTADHGSLPDGADTAGCPATPMPRDGDAVEAPAPRPLPPAPDEVRYVIYTSGSTGRPKGALVEHRGMLNHLWAKVADLGLDGADRLAQTAPLGFDISVWQMLAPLLVGGTVQIYSDDEARDGTLLLSRVRDRGTTVLEIVPTLILFLLDAHGTASATGDVAGDVAGDAAGLGGLRWMIGTGEELPPALARRWCATFPGIRLLNAYGPTECSDDVTHAVLDSPGEDVRHLPIGGPIGNVTLYVLRWDGDAWRACPRGEAGELFVGGVAVGRGYLGDPDRTAAAFYHDPFGGPGRVYRTGDLVRVLASGELEYLGRADRQVKIGGVRMELGEIEAVLGAHPAVAACAVTVPGRRGGRALVARESAFAPAATPPARLVAHIVRATPNSTPARAALQLAGELRRHLAARLPRAMVPQEIVELDRLPLTPNGKVDHAALAAAARRGPRAPAWSASRPSRSGPERCRPGRGRSRRPRPSRRRPGRPRATCLRAPARWRTPRPCR
ncbi:amino acid adenylation domain-containing protein [Actinomadura roseirufa]|uniref:amino acid adenylation domain-containing protein n=1 Tax=Actinomadura roseirufa TaxID=2094049 RepID=UPI0010410C21|nr:amino acid adenylation domain-containing protein [Actinomadura roseirufa]